MFEEIKNAFCNNIRNNHLFDEIQYFSRTLIHSLQVDGND